MKINKLIIFACIFIMIGLTIVVKFPKEFYWDSLNYIDLSTKFMSDSIFDFKNFPASHRGYLWPLLLFVFQSFFGTFGFTQAVSIYIGTTFLYSFVFTFTIPFVFDKIFDEDMKGTEILLAFLICVFWSDLLVYPLTDLFGYSLLLMSLASVLKCNDAKGKMKIIWAFILGLLTYSLYNVRSMIALVSIFLLIVYGFIYTKGLSKKLLVISIIFVGVFVAGIPQSLANVKNFKCYNSMLSIDSFDKKDESLTLYQLRLGITIQKYDTVVGNAKLENDGIDTRTIYSPVGVDIVNDNGIDTLKSYSQYIDLVLRNPVQFLKIYWGHFVSYLDVQRGVYVSNLEENLFIKNSNLFLWFCFSVFMIFDFCKLVANKKIFEFIFNSKTILLLAMIFPAILTFPGVPELRFFFAVYMLIYLVLIYKLLEGLKYLRKFYFQVK